MNTPSQKPERATRSVALADIPVNGEYSFDLDLSTAEREAMVAALGLLGLSKLRFSGTLQTPTSGTVTLLANLGATVVQPCVVTLEPVRTRIDERVRRVFVQGAEEEDDHRQLLEDEDTDIEPLFDPIDLIGVMTEAIALSLPPYPRKDGAELSVSNYAAPGTEPMTDEAAKPFASLGALRDALKDKK